MPMVTPAVPHPVQVYPDLGALGGRGALLDVAGALLTIVLVVSCLMLVICAAGWGLTHWAGNVRGAMRARTGVLVSIGAAVLAGATNTWVNYLLAVGASF